MCAINGLYAYRDRATAVDLAELRATRDHMAARGPDGQGEWLSPDGRVGLGHRRLAIIDLSPAAAQPMTSADGQLVLSYNGEIYNHRALRRELEAEGCVFRTHSDTEVILHLYARRYADQGPALVQALRGMYAFALWDTQRRRLLLARDPYGIKPLYYADDGRTLRFASQVKALLAGGALLPARDLAGEAGFYLFGSVPEPYTLYQDLRALPAGSTLSIDARGPGQPTPHASLAAAFYPSTPPLPPLPPRGGGAGGEGEPAQLAGKRPAKRGTHGTHDAISAALLDSVRHHLEADVPVGAFLSAGVDSGALVGLMRDAGQQDITTVTLAFSEYRGRPDDEAPLAARTATRYGTRHVTRAVDEAEFRADLPAILAAMDQPSIDGLNTWFVAKAAREQGLKVALSGLGGDELFGGYPSFTDLPRWTRWFGPLTCFPSLGRHVRATAVRLLTPHLPPSHLGGERPAERERIHPSPLVGEGPGERGTTGTHGRRTILRHLSPKALSLLEYGGTYPGAWLLRRGLFLPWELPALMGEDRARAGLERLQPLAHIAAALTPDPGTPFGRVAALEASLYLRNQLLRDADWAGMAHSLEIRTPLVDYDLLRDLAPHLPGLRGRGKQLLAASPSQPLPEDLVQRPKTGFTTPIAHWLERLPASGLSQRPGHGVVHGHGNDLAQKKDQGPDQSHLPPSAHWSRHWALYLMRQPAFTAHNG